MKDLVILVKYTDLYQIIYVIYTKNNKNISQKTHDFFINKNKCF